MKVIISLFLILTVCAAVIAAVSDGTASSIIVPQRQGVNRVSNYEPRLHIPTINQFVFLESTYEVKNYGVGRGGASNYGTPKGAVRVRSIMTYGYPVTQISVKVKHLPTSAEAKGQFEAWLVDDNTNYRLSLGTFNTQTGGVADLRYVADMYVNQYDYVEITFEPLHDIDTEPGPLVLYGRIAPQSSNAIRPYNINELQDYSGFAK